jgi:hypothetical protein
METNSRSQSCGTIEQEFMDIRFELTDLRLLLKRDFHATSFPLFTFLLARWQLDRF